MKHIILILFLSLNILSFGQEKDDITYHQAPNTVAKENKKSKNIDYLERISVGGTGGLQVGDFTYIELSPSVAYHFNDYFCVGVGGTYIFYQDNYINYTDHIYGPRAFAEGHFFNFVGIHAAYQGLSYKSLIFDGQRTWSNNLCVGGGFYQKTGRISYYLFLLWNFSDRPPEENFYSSSLLFNVGFAVFLK